MTVQVSTVGRLQSLLDLYRSGYRSPVVDQTVGKLIALEIARCRTESQRLVARLSAYEQQYHMTSDEFYRRFRNGELGDDMDLVEWSILLGYVPGHRKTAPPWHKLLNSSKDNST